MQKATEKCLFSVAWVGGIVLKIIINFIKIKFESLCPESTQ